MNQKQKSSLSNLLTVALAVGIALGFSHYVIGFARVPTGSMYPEIEYPSFVVVNHLNTEFGSISRGEIVLFHFPDDPKQIFVKRVIGLPGDTIATHDGHVYINGHQLSEPYLTVPTEGDFGPVKVPSDHYFMMGDNRQDSDDSRFWHNMFVSKSAIIGQATTQLYPHIKQFS